MFPRLGKFKYIAYCYLLILLIGALLPLGQFNRTLNDNYTLHIRWDYLIHAFAYMPISVLLGLGFINGSRNKTDDQIGSIRSWIIAFIVALLIAASFEILQLLIPYRRFNINDMLANCLGVIIGLLGIPIARKFVSRIKRD